MMTSISKLELPSRFSGMSSREVGQRAFEEMLIALAEADVVELDFQGKEPTPSFADQAVGSLARHLGLDAFRARVKLINVPDGARALLKHVILKGAAPKSG